MTYTAHTLPEVNPMMVRKIIPTKHINSFGGVMVMDECEAVDDGMADSRFDWDEDVVDCSGRMFEITNWVMFELKRKDYSCMCFPSRRWRNIRHGMDFNNQELTDMYAKKLPLLYIGNPVRIFYTQEDGCLVVRIPEFLIKSGMELGF